MFFQWFLLISVWLVGLLVFALSFFFSEPIEFSPSQENDEQILKNTGFTKLTKRLQMVYFFLILVFFTLLFLYNLTF